MLERGKHAQGFLGVPADGKVMNDLIGDHAFRVDDEQAAKCDAAVGENAIVAGDLLVEVGEERIIQFAKSPVFACGVDPGEVGVVAVDGAADELSVKLLEVFGVIGKVADVCPLAIVTVAGTLSAVLFEFNATATFFPTAALTLTVPVKPVAPSVTVGGNVSVRVAVSLSVMLIVAGV